MSLRGYTLLAVFALALPSLTLLLLIITSNPSDEGFAWAGAILGA
jgi:hypothetical protein